MLRQNLAPCVLRVIQDEGDKVDQRLFLLVAGRIGLADRRCRVSDGTVADERQEVAFENDAQDEQDDHAAQSEVNSSGLKAATTAFVAPIFNVVAASARCPAHV